jgi:hypothetical protein
MCREAKANRLLVEVNAMPEREDGTMNEEDIVKFMLWLRKERTWIFDSLCYTDEKFEQDIRRFLKEFDRKTKSKT